jgi:hypothetical protein
MIGRQRTTVRNDARRRRRLAAVALLDLEIMPRIDWRNLDLDRMLALGIDPRF